MEVFFRGTGDDGRNLIKKVSGLSDEKFDRYSLFGSWIDFVERAPYNTKCFNHWRTTKIGIGTGASNYTTEDLQSTLSTMEKGLFPQTITGVWTTILSYKIYFGLFLEAFDPTNVANHFSPSFPQGDNNGKEFIVKYKGEKTNLHEFWGSLCGQLNKHYPFDDAAWKEIDKFTYEISKAHGNAPRLNTIQDALNQSLDTAVRSVYEGVELNKELSDEYVSKCREVAPKILASASYSLAKKFKTMSLPTIQPIRYGQPLSQTLALGYAVLLILVPVAIFMAGRAFCNRHEKSY